MKNTVKNVLKSATESFSTWRRRAFEALVLICCLSLVLTTLSYSWIRRKWTPSISENDIQIMSGDSLVLSLLSNDYTGSLTNQSLSLNQIMNLEDFVFRPVSNFSGKSADFFTLNTNVLEDEYFSHIMQGEVITSEGWTVLGQTYGYIELTFVLQGRDIVGSGLTNYTKYVYLNYNTNISVSSGEEEAYKAIRVSLTCGEEEDAPTYIFVPKIDETARAHQAITNSTAIVNGISTWIADGIRYRADSGDNTAVLDASGILRRTKATVNGNTFSIVETNSSAYVTTFDAYNGGFVNGSGTFDETKCLCTIQPGSTKKITLRIWLEGEDPLCTSSIKGSKINFYLGFESYNKSNEVVTTTETTTSGGGGGGGGHGH